MNHLFLRGKEPQGLVLFLPAEEGGRVHLGQPGGGPKGRGLGQGLGDEGGLKTVHLGLEGFPGVNFPNIS